ncbi:MAG: hypothetical protein NXI28_25250 [bacterium]|jgi:hypothetical protein|nr:hypothetical protein [bacterium]
MTNTAKSIGTITRSDKLVLSYGAFCGFVALLCLSGRPVIALLLGVPPGVFGIGVVLLIVKRFFPNRTSFADIPAADIPRIALAVVIGFAIIFGRAVFAGDWVSLFVGLMMLGMFAVLAFNDLYLDRL